MIPRMKINKEIKTADRDTIITNISVQKRRHIPTLTTENSH